MAAAASPNRSLSAQQSTSAGAAPVATRGAPHVLARVAKDRLAAVRLRHGGAANWPLHVSYMMELSGGVASLADADS